MRELYILRTILVSVEALVLGGAWLASVHFIRDLQSFAGSLELNEEVLRYLMFLPTALAVWIMNEMRALLQEDNETVRLLTAWPDYWKLKIHTWVGLGYAVVFMSMSLIPWIAKSGIGTGVGMVLFIASILGQLSLAIGVYAARIRIKEIIAHAKVL